MIEVVFINRSFYLCCEYSKKSYSRKPPKIIKFCKFLFTIQNILLYLELEVKKMAKKRREHRETDYVNNSELKEMVIKYNDTNPADNGEWLDKFENTM